MATVLLVIHLMIALALIVMILLQRSEGGALGMGGGGAGGGMMSGRSAANMLTRTTGYLAAIFFATSITLAILAKSDRTPTSILDTLSPTGPVKTIDSKPVVPTPPASSLIVPEKPTAPSVPNSN